MDEFKPEDELKPDASDRRPSRPRKSSPAAKIPVSRQRIMMGVGILVLLLLVLGIGSALNGPDEKNLRLRAIRLPLVAVPAAKRISTWPAPLPCRVDRRRQPAGRPRQLPAKITRRPAVMLCLTRSATSQCRLWLQRLRRPPC